MTESEYCMQGAVTTQDMFEIRSDGIFFKNSDKGLELFGSATPDINTLLAIRDVLNKAYQVGFSDGVQIGLKMK